MDDGRQKDVLLMLVALQFAVVGWFPLVLVSYGITASVLVEEAIRQLDEFSQRA